METGVQSQVKSHQRLKKWYLMPPHSALWGIIRYGSRISGAIQRKKLLPPLPIDYSQPTYLLNMIYILVRLRTFHHSLLSSVASGGFLRWLFSFNVFYLNTHKLIKQKLTDLPSQQSLLLKKKKKQIPDSKLILISYFFFFFL